MASIFSYEPYNFLNNYPHNKPIDSSPLECLIHTLLSSGETPRCFLHLAIEVSVASPLRASGSSSSSSPPVSPSSDHSSVSRSHFIADDETIQDVLNTYKSPTNFRFFTETFYQHSQMPPNWWLSARTEKDSKEVFWYLKKNPVLTGNEIIYNPTEGPRAILDELKQYGIFPQDDDLSKLTPYAEFETFRLLWNDPNIFVDVARFGENDYYALVTLKNPIASSGKLRSQGNTKIAEYLQTVDPSRIQEGVDIRHNRPSPFHFKRFPTSLITGGPVQQLLKDYGPKPLVEFLQCRHSLHKFFGLDSPFKYVPNDDEPETW